jgi:predicted amidophosphoribosyltransferase
MYASLFVCMSCLRKFSRISITSNIKGSSLYEDLLGKCICDSYRFKWNFTFFQKGSPYKILMSQIEYTTHLDPQLLFEMFFDVADI